MRTIIAGGRTITDMAVLDKALASCPWRPSTVISGAARGVDKLGELWAAANGVPCEKYPADWAAHGLAAGPIRNRLMANTAEALIALWDGESRGTKNMIAEAKARNLAVHVYRVDQEKNP